MSFTPAPLNLHNQLSIHLNPTGQGTYWYCDYDIEHIRFMDICDNKANNAESD